MTETLPRAVVPYARFVERRNRRLRITAELGRPEAQQATVAEAVAVAVAVDVPLPSEQTHRYEGSGGMKNPERAT